MIKTCPNCGNTFNGRVNAICCSEKCYQAYYFKIHKKEKTVYTVICARCGKEFETTSHLAKYCSEQCKYNRKGTNINKVCPICGNHFVTNRIDKIYCCKKCKDERVNKEHYKRPTYEKKCVVCGKTFYSSIKSKKFCSENCKYERDKIRLKEYNKTKYKLQNSKSKI